MNQIIFHLTSGQMEMILLTSMLMNHMLYIGIEGSILKEYFLLVQFKFPSPHFIIILIIIFQMNLNWLDCIS